MKKTTMAQRAQAYEAQYVGEIADRQAWETAMQIREWHETADDEGEDVEPIPQDILEWAQAYEK